MNGNISTIEISHFIPWSQSYIIREDGKHLIEFDPNFPIHVGCYRFSADRPLTPNYHDYFEIAYIYKGSALVRVGNRNFKFSTGDLLVIGDTAMHTVITQKNITLYVLALYFSPTLIFRQGFRNEDFDYISFFYDQRYSCMNRICSNDIDNLAILELMVRAYRIFLNKTKHYKILLKNCVYQILTELLLYYDNLTLPVDTIKKNQNRVDLRRFQSVYSLVENNFQGSISLEEAAKTANMSQSHFCKYFKRTTGCTFTEYVQHVRIDKAKELLLDSELSTTQIAYHIGFNNLSHFYRTFKRLTHYPPQEFTRQVKTPS